MRTSWACAFPIAMALAATAPRTAFAQSTDGARAEALYDQALALTDAGRYPEACPKLEESQRLDPALGTQFNLADCYDHVGRIATALALFTEVERAAKAAGKAGLQGRAHARIEQLVPRAPKLRLVFERPEPVFDVKVDGAPVDALLAAGAGVPIDPGAHKVVVGAPGRIAWSSDFTAVEAKVGDVRVAPLANAAASPPSSDVPITPRSRTMTITAISLGGAGVAAVGVGAVFGLITLSKRSEATKACKSDQPKECQDQTAVHLWGEAKDSGNVSTIAFIAGGALIAAGAVVWLVSAPSKPQKAALTGATSGDGASVVLRGWW